MRAKQQSLTNASNSQYTDLGVILRKYVYHWPLFLLCLLLAFSAAYAYVKIINPTYEIGATILVKDEKKTPQEKSALQELDQSSSPKIAEAEIEILKSKKLINQVVNQLDLWITYKTHSDLKSHDIYETRPFKFILLQKSGILDDEEITVFVKDKNTFEVKNESGQNKTSSFNKSIKDNFGTWLLKPTDDLTNYVDSTITITLNDPEKVASSYVKSLDAHLLDKSAPTIGLFITDEVTQRGKDFLNNLIVAYNEATSAEEMRATKSTIDFIDNRLASLTGELNLAEREVEGFRSSKGLTDIDSQSKVYLENVQSNDIKLNEVNVQLNVIDGIERYVNSTSNSENAPATIGITDPGLNSLIEKLSQLQLRRVALLATTPEGNPAFEPINRQIRIAKAAITQNIQSIKSSLLNTKRELQSFNTKFESSIKNIPGQERQFVSMKRQQAIKENLYIYLLQKREELSLSYASTLADTRIVDQANIGDKVWPKIPFVLAIALILGLIVPFLIIYIRETLNNKITDRTDIENSVDVRILGELSYEDLGDQRLILDNSHQMVGEQFRSLRTNLHYLHNNQKGVGRVTLFTSSVSGEGKTFISSNLAASLAVSDRKTVILEMDLRKPKISGIFNLKQGHTGISDFLSSDIPVTDIIQHSSITNLDVIGVGQIPPNPSELLEKSRLEDLISYLKQNYDDVLIDSPPVHLVTDALIIAKFADVSLYIIKQGHTGKAEIRFIRELQENEKFPNMNIIFNGIKKGKYGYGYNYDNSYYTEKQKQDFSTSFKLFLNRF